MFERLFKKNSEKVAVEDGQCILHKGSYPFLVKHDGVDVDIQLGNSCKKLLSNKRR